MVNRFGSGTAVKIQIPSPMSAVHKHVSYYSPREWTLCLHKFIRLLRPISLLFSIQEKKKLKVKERMSGFFPHSL